MQCFLSNKTRAKTSSTPRPIPTPTQIPHSEFQKFNTYTEGMILDEIERLSKDEKEKQKEIDELYQKLLEKEQEDEKKIEKIKLPLSLPNAKTEIGGLKPKISAVSKNSSSKPSRTVFRSPLPRWH